MTHHHATQETVNRQPFGGSQVSFADHLARLVHQLGLAIDDARIAGCELSQSCQDRIAGKSITCIQEADVSPTRTLDALVHRIIQPLVGFAEHTQRGNGRTTHDIERVVGRCAIDDEHLVVGVRLTLHALQCWGDNSRSIPRDSDDGK